MKDIIVGQSYTTRNYGSFKVVKINSWKNITIEFYDGTLLVTKSPRIRSGDIKNPNKVTCYGVGYIGVGKYKSASRAYKTWNRMLERCYCPRKQAKCPTYIGTEVCPEWHNFQVFAEWYNNHKNANKFGFHLDKDLRVLGSKFYSASTCDIIPREVNLILGDKKAKRGQYPIGVCFDNFNQKFKASVNIGGNGGNNLGHFDTPEEAFSVYKTRKENLIKEVANKFKEDICEQVYLNLMNYEIEQFP